jgi:hypothetical protein
VLSFSGTRRVKIRGMLLQLTPMLATTVNYGVASSSLCAESQIGITRRIRGTLKKQAPFIRGHLAGVNLERKGAFQEQTPDKIHGWLKLFGSPGYPHYDWRTIVIGCTES